MAKKKKSKKQLILEFIQEKGLELRKTIPGIIGVRYEEKPDRMVLTVSEAAETPSLDAYVTDFTVEVERPGEIKPVIMVDRGDGATPEAEEKAEKSGWSSFNRRQ
jgi:hypothetical protein